MIDRKHLNLLQQQRNLPLNQTAGKLLKEAKQTPDPELLPVFQLMLWGLSEGIAYPTRQQTELMQEATRTLAYERSPKEAMAYLIRDDLGETTLTAEHLQGKEPLAAAQELIETLDLKMKADPNLPYPK